MGSAAEFVSIILKYVIGGKTETKLFDDLADAFIEGSSEKFVNELKTFVRGKKFRIERVLSRESMKSLEIAEDMIDYVTAEIKELLLSVEITDEILRKCKYSSKSLYDFLWSGYRKNKNDHIEYESEIKRSLFAVAGELTELAYESENFSEKMLIQISNGVDDANVELQRISGYIENNFSKLDAGNQAVSEMLRIMIKEIHGKDAPKDSERGGVRRVRFKNDKKQDYINSWNSRLFLHTGNDANPVTLADAFIIPDYKIHKDIGQMNFSGDDTLDKIIEKFMRYDRTSTMLIAGVPGIGKSSITAWMANEYKNDERIIILRFRDWKRVVLEKTLLSAVCSKLDCEEEDLEDRVLILDGFDEMKALNSRVRLLNEFFVDIKDFKNFKCIITSRPAYIEPDYFSCVIVLKEFSLSKIESFYKKITGNELHEKEKIKFNVEVLGIPVILYMAVMSDVDISKSPTKPELYNRIFAEKGGIFDRFYDGKVEYGNGMQILRNPDNIKIYLGFLRDVAFKMFEKNDLYLSEGEYRIPELETHGDFVSILEFPIKYLFENTALDLEFIHKSIYEYFVAEYIFTCIKNEINAPGERLANVLGLLFKKSMLPGEVIEFLRYKIKNTELVNKFDIINHTFRLMLKDGMTYHTGEWDADIIDCEMNVFANMLEIIHLFGDRIIEIDRLVCKYLKYNRFDSLKLNNMVFSWSGGVNLERVYLKSADLKNADLRNADLIYADFRDADLTNAELVRANLKNSDFRNANLKNVDLRGANLTGAIFDEQQIKYLSGSYDLDRTKVYIVKSERIVSYEEYREGKNLRRSASQRRYDTYI